MQDLLQPSTARHRHRQPTSTLTAINRWENEGGAQPGGHAQLTILIDVTVRVIQPAMLRDTSLIRAAALDARQDDIMAAESSDGRAPTHTVRRFEWLMFALGATLALSGLIIWAAIAGIHGGTVIAAVAYTVLMLVGASPVLIAGLMRGKEQRAARAKAKGERHVVRVKW